MDDAGEGFRGKGRGFRSGFKRQREEEPLDPVRLLLSTLMAVGDKAMPSLQMDPESIVSIAKNVKREARSNPSAVHAMLIDCAVQLPHKVPLYSLIIGVINAEEPAFVAELLFQISKELGSALQHPEAYRKARLLLRLLAALVVPGVLQPASVLAALQTLVSAALQASTSAPEGDDGRSWQPYTDHLVYMALMALPFGGSELAEAEPEGVDALMATAQQYLEERPRSQQPGLRPFASAIKEDDPVAETDNGGASFLTEVVQAVGDMVDKKVWTLQGIPRVHAGLETTLAAAPQSHTVPAPAVPSSPPVEVPEGTPTTLVGALVLQAFPPRGIVRFLDPQHTLGDRSLAERLVAQDYFTDTIAWFEGDRVECAKQLARSLPLPYSFEPLLCEVLFSQMLRLPAPEFKPIMYSSLMVELCKLLKLFPRAMSACVRENFARMNVMDPALRERMAEWLAYHLSNFEYVWPWSKWEHVLAAPAYDGQRRFCVAVMNRMVRLCYWEHVRSVIPNEFAELLPPKPLVAGLPPAGSQDAVGMDLEGVWAARALEQLVKKKAPADTLDAWVTENKLESVLGGKIGVLRMLIRCLLVAGAKSYSHMIVALERYYGPLALLAKDTGLEGQVAVVSTAADTWALNPQRAVMAVDRLMTLRLVSAEAIVSWVFGPEGVQRLSDQSRSGMAWEMLRRAVSKTIARVQDAVDDLAIGRAAVAAMEAAVEAGHALPEQLDMALGALPEKEAYFAETTGQQQGAVLQVLKLFVQALSSGGFAGPSADEMEDGGGALDADSSEHTALRDYVVASLRSFMREYHVQVAQVEQHIQDDILPGASQEVAQVMTTQLRL